MLALLLSLLIAVFARGSGLWLLSRWRTELDPAEDFGLTGLVGLFALGALVFLIGLVSVPAAWAALLLPALGWGLVRGKIFPAFKFSRWSLAGIPFAIISLANALAPSDMLDWDSLAYHLAVPKLWIQAGKIEYVPTIHHSNFPFAFDSLYILGLQLGHSAGAKAFTIWAALYGLCAVFGMVRRCTGSAVAPWVAVAAVASCPVVLWECGSGYIDVAHGLAAGLATLYIAEYVARPSASRLGLACALVGCATASKYTGLQTLVILAMILFIAGAWRRDFRSALVAPTVLVAFGLLACSPWLARNVVNTGNPVYPFLYEKFGSPKWDQWRADIYRDEQQSFGIGRTPRGRDVRTLPAAVLGMATEPGRYINPRPDLGQGFPTGAVGFVPFAVLGLWMATQKRDVRGGVILAAVAMSCFLWFFLSQQSRYAVSLIVPIAALAGILFVRMPRWLVGAMVLAQGVYAVGLLYTINTVRQLPVVLGTVSESDFTNREVSFARMAPAINREAKGGKVALFDEVFGYLLDVPYIWANPGHSKVLPYESMQTADDLVAAFHQEGITHVYLNLQYMSPDVRRPWADGSLSYANRDALMSDLNRRWLVLLAEATKQGQLEIVDQGRQSLLMRVR